MLCIRCMYVCVPVRAGAHTCRCVYPCASGGQRTTLVVFPEELYFLDRVFHWPRTYQVGTTGQPTSPRDPHVPTLLSWDYKHVPPHLVLLIWFLVELNSDPHAYWASTSQPNPFFFSFIFNDSYFKNIIISFSLQSSEPGHTSSRGFPFAVHTRCAYFL